ncbi:hypothetical protein PMAYCL1PPCAC_00834, partial [Pristionchus mayeri]
MDDGYLLVLYLVEGDVSPRSYSSLMSTTMSPLYRAGSMDPEMTTVMGALVPVKMKNPENGMSADEPT